MYLSQLVLDPRQPAVRRDLGNCQELHRTLLQAFPDGVAEGGADGARARVGLLYRVEITERGRRAAVLAQSAIVPDWSRLPPGYRPVGWPKEIDAAYAAIREGMRLRFRLRANATRRIAKARDEQEQKWVGKRVDIRNEAELLGWLTRKGDANGFRPVAVRAYPDVPDVRTGREGTLKGRKPGMNLTFGSVVFDGELVVTDAAAFRRALAQGIGSGKAYGFGLLSVARAGT